MNCFPHVAAAIAAAVAVSAPSAPNAAEAPFEEARLYFELNHTDGDLGIHGLIDGGPWKALEIEDPYGNVQLDVLASSRFLSQGMTEIFFESAEPSFDELAPARFFRRFPEGLYEISGVRMDGRELENRVRISHVMPGPPTGVRINGDAAAPDCDSTLPRVGTPVVITWNAVTRSHPYVGKPGPVQVEQYQVFTEFEEGSDSKFALDLPPNVTRFHVPVELIRQAAPGDVFKFEILVRAESGNQTAVESCFVLR